MSRWLYCRAQQTRLWIQGIAWKDAGVIARASYALHRDPGLADRIRKAQKDKQ